MNSRFKLLTPFLIIFCTFLLYSNTLNHEYTQDDAIVIYDNMFTQEGISGIKGILSKDTFFGFFKEEGKANLVSGGRYRPFTLILFALEVEFFGLNPFYGHLFNVLWYCGLVFLIFTFFKKLIQEISPQLHFHLASITAILFAIHPVHTEAVANIKGRDEICALFFSILTTHLLVNKPFSKQSLNMLLGLLSFFIALMSKENSITFLAIIPLTFYIFKPHSLSQALKASIPLWLVAICFITIRASIIGMNLGDPPLELMNNPFIKIVNGNYVSFNFLEKMGTIGVILLKYVQLLFFPIELTNDYYPYKVAITSLTNIKSLFAYVTYIGLFVWAMFNLKKSKFYSYGILFYLITISIVSNIVFPIGTNMSERFLFMPSLGFSLCIAYLITTKLKKQNLISIMVLLLAVPLSLKTFSRNMDWKDDYTLFMADVHTSNNSAKALNAAGGAIITKYSQETNSDLKNQKLAEAIGYLQKAVQIHPNYKNAHLLLGNAYYYSDKLEAAQLCYQNVINLNNNDKEALKNLAITLRDRGRIAGEKEQNLDKAKEYLLKSLDLAPKDTETLRLLGVSFGIGGQHKEAIYYFTKVTELDPQNAFAFLNLSNAYKYANDNVNAQLYLNKALELDPQILSK